MPSPLFHPVSHTHTEKKTEQVERSSSCQVPPPAFRLRQLQIPTIPILRWLPLLIILRRWRWLLIPIIIMRMRKQRSLILIAPHSAATAIDRAPGPVRRRGARRGRVRDELDPRRGAAGRGLGRAVRRGRRGRGRAVLGRILERAEVGVVGEFLFELRAIEGLYFFEGQCAGQSKDREKVTYLEQIHVLANAAALLVEGPAVLDHEVQIPAQVGEAPVLVLLQLL